MFGCCHPHILEKNKVLDSEKLHSGHEAHTTNRPFEHSVAVIFERTTNDANERFPRGFAACSRARLEDDSLMSLRHGDNFSTETLNSGAGKCV